MKKVPVYLTIGMMERVCQLAYAAKDSVPLTDEDYKMIDQFQEEIDRNKEPENVAPKTNKEVTELYRQMLKDQLGDEFDEDTFKKALGRCKTWCQNAYGGVDLVEHYNESGSLSYYYAEVQKNDQRTFNRDAYQNRRRD